MDLGLEVSLLPKLLPGEKVLFFKKCVRASSGKSPPSYRLYFGLPPLLEAGLYVTDRRILHVAFLCRLMKQEFSQWFEGKGPPGDHDLVKSVALGRSRLFGSYLEVVSENSERHWYRSPWCRVRLFMRDAEPVRLLISHAMTARNGSGY